jgi:hypothetical protein
MVKGQLPSEFCRSEGTAYLKRMGQRHQHRAIPEGANNFAPCLRMDRPLALAGLGEGHVEGWLA